MIRPTTLLVRATCHPVPMMRKHPRYDPTTGRDLTTIYRHPQTTDGSDDTSKLLEPTKVENNSYYRRSIRRGDLEEVKAAKKPAPKLTLKG